MAFTHYELADVVFLDSIFNDVDWTATVKCYDGTTGRVTYPAN